MFEDDAIKSLIGELNATDENGQTDEELDPQNVEGEHEDGDADEDEDNDQDSDSEGDEEGDSDEDEDNDDDQPEGASDDTVIKWKTAAGEEFSVPVAELKNGYMRQDAFTQKSQALAKEKEAVVQQTLERFQQVDMYSKELGALHNTDAYIQQLQQTIGQTSKIDDPLGYQSLVSDLMMAQQTREGLASRVQQVHMQRTQEQQALALKAQEQAVKVLSEGPDALPNFGPELVKKISESGKQYGLTDEELSGITDPKYIRILHDAMKYRELQSKKPEAVKKVKAAPQRQTRTVPQSRAAKVTEQFNKNPSIENMVGLFNMK